MRSIGRKLQIETKGETKIELLHLIMPRGKAAAKAAAVGAKATGRPASGEPKAKKPRVTKGHQLAEQFPGGEVLCDLCKKKWKLGSVIGQGGFGLIYLASEEESTKKDADYVVKIEPMSNGPLFCELHFYQRVAKPEMIDNFIRSHRLKYLGVPKYIAAGQHVYKGTTYRFMVMQRFSTDLQKIFENAGKQFTKQTVFALTLRMLDALEYIHENNYVHADVKASNCLLGYKAGKTDNDVVYLVDYGLATKYVPDGKHKEYKEEPKKAHDGTVEFTSIDAHKGVAPSRRGDLEILGYCALQWLCGRLPWEDKLTDKNYVRDAKIKYMNDIPGLMKKCFPGGGAPEEISSFLVQVKKLGYTDKPNYNQLRDIFTKGLTKLGIKDTWKLALPLGGAPKPSTSSPKKGVKRKSTEPEQVVQKMKARVTSPGPSTPKAQAGGSTTPTPGPSKAKKSKIAVNGPAKGKPGTPASGAATPGQVKSPMGRIASPVAAKSPPGRVTSPAQARSPAPSPAGRPKAKAKKTTTKARTQVTSRSPIDGRGAASSSHTVPRLMSPNGDAQIPKKRKIRRKNVQMTEMAVQTSPGLKLNR